jgi:hypothetical protein
LLQNVPIAGSCLFDKHVSWRHVDLME